MILIDANVLIWCMVGDKRLGNKAREILAQHETALSISLLTLFEIELKRRVNKLEIQSPISNFLDIFGVEVYSPSANELHEIMGLKINHSDPFDCALIGLAKLKGWAVMASNDPLEKVGSGLVTIIDSKK